MSYVRGDSDGAVEIVNNWVADKTNNKITKLVSADDVDERTRLILVNAIYFKGDWLRKFNITDTKDDDFHISPNESVTVKMMNVTADFFYTEIAELKCQAIELPYVEEKLSMFILLPDQEATNLSEVEQKLTFRHLADIRNEFQMTMKQLHLWLPKFSLDEKLSLTRMLGEMGMQDLFTMGVADLSGMDGSDDLYVSNVLHRAVVEVSEEGTEASAATAVVVAFESLRPPAITFRANHPFIFLIQDKATKSILFLGRLANPSTSVSSGSTGRREALVTPLGLLLAMCFLLFNTCTNSWK